MHTIRLRGPWKIEALARLSRDEHGNVVEDTSDLPAATETNVPSDWCTALGPDFRGRVRYVRRFGLPTNLDPDERVLLVVGEIVENALIELNGASLGRQAQSAGEQSYEVTPLLRPRNELMIVIEALQAAGGMRGEVKLEIYEGVRP
jgi:hypothetical protein